MMKRRNLSLGALPLHELPSLQSHLETVPLSAGSIVLEANEISQSVYFVESGIISILAVTENHSCIGVATVGREGMAGGAALLLGGKAALGRHRVLVSGSALAIKVSQFRMALRGSPKLRGACDAHMRALFIQVLQAVACTKLHTDKQRCARWLLTCVDQIGDDAFELDPGCLAEMLGVRGSNLTATASTLQQEGLIRYAAGAVTVLDRQGLEAAACGCYRMVSRSLSH